MATRKIETQISLTGEKEFNDQMKSLNNNMKNLEAEMKAVTSEFDENATAADRLKNKHSVLTQQIDQQEEIVRALTEMYEKQKGELGEDAAATDKYRRAMLNAQAKLNGYKRDLAQVDSELEDVAKSTDKAGDESQKAAPKFKLSAEQLNKVWSAAKKVGSALGTVAGTLTRAGLGLAKFAVKGTIIDLAALGVASGSAAAGLAALSAKGLKQLATYAIQAAQSGNPAFEKLSKSLKDLDTVSTAAKDALGKVLLPELESFTERGVHLLDAFSREMEATNGDTEAMGDVMARYIRQAARLIRIETPAFIEAGGGFIRGLTQGIIAGEDEFKIIAEDVVGQIAGFLEDNADDMGAAAAVLLSTFGELITENADELMGAGITMIEKLLEGMDGEELGEGAADLVLELVKLLVEVAPDLAEAGLAFVGGLLNGIVENWDDIENGFIALKDGLVETAKGWWEDWSGAGAEWMKGLLAGLQEWWQTIVEWWNGVKDSLSFSTPKYTGSMGSTGGNSVGNRPREATGMDIVPSDWYPVYADKDEMILKAPLARELRGLGVTNASSSIYGALNRALGTAAGGGGGQHIDVNIRFGGSLSQLARVLKPEIDIVTSQQGEAYVN